MIETVIKYLCFYAGGAGIAAGLLWLSLFFTGKVIKELGYWQTMFKAFVIIRDQKIEKSKAKAKKK